MTTLEQLEQQVRRLQKTIDMLITPGVFDVRAERILLNYARLMLAANKTLTTSGDVTIGNVTNGTTIDEGGTLHLGAVTHDLNAAFTYTESTWTPKFTSNLATFTYTTKTGRYTRIGNQCVIHGYILLDGAPGGTPSSEIFIDDLPFTAANTGLYPGISIATIAGVDVDASCVQLTGRVVPNTKTIAFRQMRDNSTALSLTAAAWAAGAYILFSAVYEV